ncbi:MAG TPA: hypothetical protein VEB42_02915 [Chitinophagaceae bacterium]|nr:hypothetical protein [Chitinophagaceae bacterium]
MTTETLNTAKGYQATIDKVNEIQARLTAATGEKGIAAIVDAESKTLVNQQELIGAIGQAAYDTLAADTLAAINTALAAAKTAAQTSLTAL